MEEDEEHRQRYQTEKLADSLPPGLGYYLEKVSEARWHPDQRGLARGGLEQIRVALDSARHALRAREEWEGQEFIRIAFEQVEWPMTKLDELLQLSSDVSVDTDGLIDVCVYTLDGRIKEIRQLLVDMDRSYARKDEQI